MNAYIINITRDVSKLTADLADIGISCNIIEGINGHTMSSADIKANTFAKLGVFIPRGVIGCAKSHLVSLETFLNDKSNNDTALIFEDNAVLVDDYKTKLNNIIENLPPDFDVVLLQGNQLFKGADVANNEYLRTSNVFIGTSGYIVSRRGARSILDFMNHKIITHYDTHLFFLSLFNKLIIYDVRDKIVYRNCDNSKSLIVSAKFPYVINEFCKCIPCADRNLEYMVNLAIFRIGDYNITPLSLFFLIVGIVLAKLRIRLTFITITFLILIIPDLFCGGSLSTGLILQIVVSYMLVILPSLINLKRTAKKEIK